MAQYFIDSTERLIIACVMAGLMAGFSKAQFPEKEFGIAPGRILKYSIFAGILFAIVMAVLKNSTSLIDTGMWNLYIYGIALIAFILFVIFFCFLKKAGKKRGILSASMLGILSFLIIFYSLPDVLGYPYTIYVSEKSFLATAFLTKTIGVIFGIILDYLVGLGVYKASSKINGSLSFGILTAVLAVNTYKQVTAAFSILLARRYIKSNHLLFSIAKYSSNYSDVFIYITLLLAAVIPVVLLIRSQNVNEPYENPAQHRKIIAKWRNIKRWSSLILICSCMVVFTMTAFEKLTSNAIELSPIEDAVIKDDAVWVPFEQVSDGHLHRFGYTTDNNITIRFIVIQKPGSSSYGVGLDACDICGQTGYYEKNDQVVCNLCDVVMNISTIGFKGGCNPIVIPYEIKDGNIVVPISGLVEYESEFK